MDAAPYFDLVREMRDPYNHRLRLVQFARQHGIKPTARHFATTVPTVRKWLRRFRQHGPSGLRGHSRAHRHCPHKTSAQIEQQVLALRQKLPTFGAARLKREFDLPVSHMAIQRIWREHGLIRKRRKKYQRKQDLAAVKATWRLFQQISADTTDNGSEFIGGHDPQGHRTGFPAALGDSQHLRIPPAAHTYQSDVETVHRLVEDEFFDLESFTSRGEFLAKAQTYQLYFNLARPNSHKENQTPWQIIQRLAPRSPLELCLLPPVFLDYYLNDSGGYDVPSYP